MSRPSKLAVGGLLLLASACVAFPLYSEVVPFGSGPPMTTVWSGLPREYAMFRTVVVVPELWSFTALCLSGIAWVVIARRGWAILFVAFAQVGYASLVIGGTNVLPGGPGRMLGPVWAEHVQSGPETALWVAISALSLAAAVILRRPKSSAPPPGRGSE